MTVKGIKRFESARLRFNPCNRTARNGNPARGTVRLEPVTAHEQHLIARNTGRDQRLADRQSGKDVAAGSDGGDGEAHLVRPPL
jgi:hypothetical protein